MVNLSHDPNPSDDSASLKRRNRQVQDYRSRSAKLRLMVIVFSVMTVVVLLGELLKPDGLRRMFGQADIESSNQPDEEIDTRIDAEPPLPLGVFRTEPEVDTEDPTAGTSELGIPLARYRVIKDNRVFRSAELPIWFETWESIRDLALESDQEADRSWDASQASFTQLYRQPEEYRGKLVSVSGTVRRVDYHQAHKNTKGIDGYYQCWLWSRGSINPIVVYALELPDGFETGEEVSEDASFTGVFFKRWAYKAKGRDAETIMTAPVVLACQTEWKPEVPAKSLELPSLQNTLLGLVGLTVLAGGIAYGAYRNSLHSHGKVNQYRAERENAEVALDDLSHLDIPSEEELVRSELARRENKG